MFLLRPSARVRIALAGFGAVLLLGWPESRATAVAAAQRQAIGRAVPRDPQPRSVMRRTAARAQALREASARRLDHIPGEVVVKFRDGMPSFRRQRALTALRSRPSVNDLEWHGEVALLRQPMDQDVHVLARTLAAQPEVEYAEPNYLVRLTPRREPVHFDPFHLVGYYYTVALNIKDPETERLASEVAALTGETKTRAVREALVERKHRLEGKRQETAAPGP